MRKSKCLVASVISGIFLTFSNAHAVEVEASIRGVWKGASAESCKAVRDITTEDYFILYKTKMERYEGSCGLTEIAKIKNDFVIKGVCETEGETSRLNMRIRMIDKNHIIVDGKQKYERCR